MSRAALALRLLSALALIAALVRNSALGATEAPTATNDTYLGIILKRLPSANPVNGEKWAKIMCQTCHLFPDPSLLDEPSWRKYILPKMMLFLGVKQLDPSMPKYDQARASGLFSTSALLSKKDWDDLVAYYLDKAPARLPQAPITKIEPSLKRFTIHKPEFRHSPPDTTL